MNYSSGKSDYSYLSNLLAYASNATQMKQTFTFNAPYPLQKPADLAPPPFPYTLVDGKKVTTRNFSPY
jgi:hypothetical protein